MEGTKMSGRVALVEDDEDSRETTEILIAQLDGFRCVTSFRWSSAAPRKVAEARPQVIVASFDQTDVRTMNLILAIRKSAPSAEVIAFCATASLACVQLLLASGVHSVVLKNSHAYDLTLALMAARHGGSYFSSGLARQMAESIRKSATETESTIHLTVREREVWEAVSGGRTIKEMAQRLRVSAHTAQTHVRNLYRKLGCHGRVEAAAQYWKQADLS